MIPRSLSASALAVYEGCPARYKAENIDRAPTPDGERALLGTACHAVLERWVKEGYYELTWTKMSDRDAAIQVLWNVVYPDYFSTQDLFAEGWQMLLKWVQNMDWSGRTVISTEQKSNFIIPTSVGDIPFNYIWDRCDKLDDGSIEVVDYKSVIKPVSPDELKHRIQPRAYALSAAIQFADEDVPGIWVTYDLLRYDRVSAHFTREDNKFTWDWLKSIAERIIADDGTTEKLNPECRYCIRKGVCNTLQAHGDGGGTLAIPDLSTAIDRRAKIKYASQGLDAALTEIDDLIMNMAEDEGVLEYETEETTLKIGGRARRTVDSERVGKIIGPELMAQYGKLGVTDLDRLLKEVVLDDNQRSQIKQLVRKQPGKATITTSPKSAFTED